MKKMLSALLGLAVGLITWPIARVHVDGRLRLVSLPRGGRAVRDIEVALFVTHNS